MPENPFVNFHSVPTANELIDIAFGRADSKSASIPQRSSAIFKAKRNEIKRIQNSNEYLLKRIKKIVQSVPNLDQIHPFYQELSHLLVNKDQLRINLGKLNGLIPVLQKLESEMIRKINEKERSKECAIVRRQYFARTASIIKKQRKTLNSLNEAREKLRIIPTIDTELPSIVLAGYPNVGKSSLVSYISTAKPEVCEYPFTTKQIVIGVYKTEEQFKLFQIFDTPGILDRPMDERNEIEKQAILALRTVSNIVIFMLDPTMTSGYSIDHQISLFKEIKKYFIEQVNVPYILLINKMDMATEKEFDYIIKKLNLKENDFIKTNAKNGENVDLLIKKIRKIIVENNLMPLNLEKFK